MKQNAFVLNSIFFMFFSMILLVSCSVYGQPFTKIDLNNADDFADLEQFGKAIKDKRIVYLDELTHGEHEVFALKSRLVKYLHQVHNFDVLLIESGLFDVNEAVKASANDKAQSIAKQAAGNIFFGYAKDPAFLNLMDYIDASRHSDSPLALAGFDGRLSGAYSVNHFVKQLKLRIKALPDADAMLTTWPQFAGQLQATIDRQFRPLGKAEIDQHIQISHQIMDALNAADASAGFDSPAYYARLLQGLVRLFEVNYQLRRFDEHDLVMADNIHWLLENIYPAQKVMVWGHYVHLNRQGYLPYRANNVTTALSQAYGKDSYIVNFSGMAGQYREFRDGTIHNLPKLTERHLAFQLRDKFGDTPQAIFIEPEQFKPQVYRDLVLHGHEYKAEFQIPLYVWRNHFDAVFLINTVSASN